MTCFVKKKKILNSRLKIGQAQPINQLVIFHQLKVFAVPLGQISFHKELRTKPNWRINLRHAS